MAFSVCRIRVMPCMGKGEGGVSIRQGTIVKVQCVKL